MIKILVIEDQPAVREIISEVVQGLNIAMEIDQASSILEAREKLTNRHDWNVIVTDLSLGDGSSLNLISELNAASITIAPVILVSGFLSDAHIQQARLLNIKHVLAKPFDPEVLLNCVRETLDLENVIKLPEQRRQNHNSRLLPEMFEMDRKLGLLFRMFDEMPKSPDVTAVCSKA